MSLQWKTKLDWLSITGKLDKNQGDAHEDFFLARVNLARRIFASLGLTSPLLETVPSAKYYAMSFVDANSKIRLNLAENLSTQGWQIVCSGDALNRHDPSRILPGFLETWKGKVTRADFAVDLIWSEISIVDIADDYRSEHGESAARSFSFISSRSGDTVYVGSRSSDLMLRIYDKGGQQNVPVDWIRVEFETKGAEAHRLTEVYLHDYRKVIARMADFLNCRDTPVSRILRSISEGQVAESSWSPRPVSDRVRWFNSQVMQAYYKLAAEDMENARVVWEKFHDIYMAQAVWNAFNEAIDKGGDNPVQSGF